MPRILSTNPGTLSDIAAKHVAHHWMQYRYEDHMSLPNNLLVDVSEHLSPWQLFNTHKVFNQRRVSVHHLWKKHSIARWKYSFQRLCYDAPVYYSSHPNSLSKNDIEMLKYIENHFRDVLRFKNYSPDDEHVQRCIMPMLRSSNTFTSHGSSTSDTSLSDITRLLDVDIWLPFIRHLTLHSSQIGHISDTKLLEKLAPTLESLAFVQLQAKDLDQVYSELQYLLENGCLNRIKIALNKACSLETKDLEKVLWLASGHIPSCVNAVNEDHESGVKSSQQTITSASACQSGDISKEDELGYLYGDCTSTVKENAHEQEIETNADWTYCDTETARCNDSNHDDKGLVEFQLINCPHTCAHIDDVLTRILPCWSNLERINLTSGLYYTSSLWHAISLLTLLPNRLKWIQVEDIIPSAKRHTKPLDSYHRLLNFLTEMSSANSPLDSLSFIEESWPHEEVPYHRTNQVKTLFCKKIEIRNVGMDAKLTNMLSQAMLQNFALQEFIFDDNFNTSQYHQEALGHLFESFSSFPTLRKIKFMKSWISEDVEEVLFKVLPSFKSLETLTLLATLKTPALVSSPKFAATLSSLSHLRELDLSWNRLGIHGCAVFASLVAENGELTTTIRRLSLSANIIKASDILQTFSTVLAKRGGSGAKRRKVLEFLGLTFLLGSDGNDISEAHVKDAASTLVDDSDVSGLIFQEAVADYIAMM